MNRDLVLNQMNWFWNKWRTAWQQWTAQYVSSIFDESEKVGNFNDIENELNTAQDLQKDRIASTLRNQPTDQACRFDTAAMYLAQDRATGDALQSGFEWDFVSVANNEFGSMGQDGPGNLQNARWDIYTKNFCDYQDENCNAGCSPPPGTPNCPGTLLPNADMDVIPSKMLFAQDTIDMQNPVALQAMDSMMFNLTGYKVPDPIVSGALGTSYGIDQMFVRREYMAQMSAVGSLLYSVVADRAPGQPAKEVQMMRKLMGVQNPSATPSAREIRRSIIEQLWDPNYYKNLYDNPSTIAQKELYLKAYGLVMLYDMISKQEKISTAYAIETADILNRSMHSRAAFTSQAPVK
jgi:hypothetical protein